ncbi:MAG: hypothetical protein HGA45_03940 [Chloroflexales bacterium]|nr:hypothetical protein [Chloroflexales bacterium]
MTVETDALAEAALQFSEAIRAERTSTLDALATERQAALQIIKALRGENQRRVRQSSGRFAVGFLIGSALGAAAIYMINQRTSEEVRLGLVARAEDTGASLGERIKAAIEAGRRAAASQEQDLWTKYRQRITEKPPTRPREDPLF